MIRRFGYALTPEAAKELRSGSIGWRADGVQIRLVNSDPPRVLAAMPLGEVEDAWHLIPRIGWDEAGLDTVEDDADPFDPDGPTCGPPGLTGRLALAEVIHVGRDAPPPLSEDEAARREKEARALISALGADAVIALAEAVKAEPTTRDDTTTRVR